LISIASPRRALPQPPGRHHRIVQTGTGLLRSHRRNAQILASTTETPRAHPPEPRPAARQTQAEASDEAPASNVAATAIEAKMRTICSPSVMTRRRP
jgi:hypothetical protein